MEKPTEYSLTWEVTDEMTAKRIGSAGSKILSTPNMVALMEAAALELAKAYLDEGMTTVGGGDPLPPSGPHSGGDEGDGHRPPAEHRAAEDVV